MWLHVKINQFTVVGSVQSYAGPQIEVIVCSSTICHPCMSYSMDSQTIFDCVPFRFICMHGVPRITFLYKVYSIETQNTSNYDVYLVFQINIMLLRWMGFALRHV